MKKQKHAAVKKNAAVPVVIEKKLLIRLSLIIALFSFLVYSNTLKHGFVLDDVSVISENTLTQQGAPALKEILSSAYRVGYTTDDNNLYRPLSKAMFAVEWQLSPNNPQIHHTVNVLLYALGCVLLFLLLVRISKINVYILFFSVMLFAAHPIHTEVVANIKSRDEILSMLFIVASLHFVTAYLKNNKVFSFAAYLLCFFLALLSKESAIVYVAIVPLVLHFFTAASRSTIVKMTAASAGVSVLYLLIHYSVIGSIGLHNIPVIDNTLMSTTSVFQQKLTAILILGKYLLLLIFPHPLSSDYSFNTIPIVTSVANIGFLLSLIVHAGLLFFAIKKFREKHILSFCILFYLVSMSIASNIFIMIGTHMAERLLFLPSIAFCIALGYGLSRLFRLNFTEPASKFGTFMTGGKAFVGVSIVIIVLFSVKTVARNKDWKSNSALFTKDVETVPNSAHMLMYYTDFMSNKDTLKTLPDAERMARLAKAKKSIDKALSIYELFPDAHYLSGRIWYESKQYDSAYKSFSRASALNPGRALYHNNVGTSLFSMGRFDEARAEFEKAVNLDKNDADHAFNLGSAYGALGEQYRSKNDQENARRMFTLAIPQFERAIQLNPNYKSAYRFAGVTYMSLGDTINGKQYLQRYEQVIDKKQGK